MSRTKSCIGILFGLSIIAGIVIGAMIKDILYPPNVEPTAAILSSPVAEEPQYEDTILFIGVDKLDAQIPILEGAWLATLCNENDHSEESVHIILITLYPIGSQITSPDQNDYTNPHPGIPIDPYNFTGLKDIPPINITEEVWSHVIFLDEYAMNLIISLTDPNVSFPIPTPSADTFIKPWKDPAGALEQQSALLTTLCEEPDAYSRYSTIQEIVALKGKHIQTSLSVKGLIKLWQLVNFSHGKTVSCEFYP